MKKITFFVTAALMILAASCGQQSGANKSKTAEVAAQDLYADLPDRDFPVPVTDGKAVSYKWTNPPAPEEGDISTTYGYAGKDLMKSYQEQLREAGFADHGSTGRVDALWTFERSEDGATLVVELGYNEEENETVISMYVNYLNNDEHTGAESNAAFLDWLSAEMELIYHANCVYLKYNQPVGGYGVEAVFVPEGEMYDKITGLVLMRFKNITTGEERYIDGYSFAVPKQDYTPRETYTLDYGLPDDADEFITAHPLYYGALPFFFADVNFDGKEELVITQFGQGQRGCSAYQVYPAEPDDNGEYNILFDAPFDRLDDFSTIDSERRQIIIQSNNSADDTSEEVYKQDENGKFYLFETR